VRNLAVDTWYTTAFSYVDCKSKSEHSFYSIVASMHDPFLRSQTTIFTWLEHVKQSYNVYRPDTDRSAVTDAAGVFYA
jgi:hypothetical protein